MQIFTLDKEVHKLPEKTFN